MRTLLAQILGLFCHIIYHEIHCIAFALLTYPSKALSREESLIYGSRLQSYSRIF